MTVLRACYFNLCDVLQVDSSIAAFLMCSDLSLNQNGKISPTFSNTNGNLYHLSSSGINAPSARRVSVNFFTPIHTL